MCICFVGDSINDYVSKVCDILHKEYNMSVKEAIRSSLETRFYTLIREDYSSVTKQPEKFWAEKISLMTKDNEVFA